jgi:Tetratricopeptide repeat.
LRLGEYQLAIQYFTNLLAKEFNVVTINNLAMSYLSIGDKVKAESLLRESLKKAPNNTEAYRNISMLKKFKEEDDADLKDIMSRINDVSLNDEQKGHLYFAMGKAYDDLGDYSLAYTAYEQGNLIKRRDVEFSIADEYEKYRDMTKAFTAKKMHDDTFMEYNDNYPIPIFIVGMPRSGTSLLEQIFATIDGVSALGELTFVENLMTSRSIEQSFIYPNDVSKIAKQIGDNTAKRIFLKR